MKTKTGGFIYGVEGLDKLLSGTLRPSTLTVILGHPGSGKTTLASTICYANALKGHKCLYISFQEDKEKMFELLSERNIDFKLVESKDLLKFIKFPILTRGEDVENVINTINDVINEFKPKVVVVDSITPILKTLSKDISARALIQNYFAELPRIVDGIVILVSEVDINAEKARIGGLEFIADIVLFLKLKIKHNLLIKELEIRKVKYVPITIARLPFTIGNNGFKVLIPPRLEEIPAISKNKIFKIPCKILQELLGNLYGGDMIYIAYPPDARPHQLLVFILALTKLNNCRTLVISYRLSPNQLVQTFEEICKEITGLQVDIRNYLGGNTRIVAFNTSAYSIEELYVRELELIDKFKPDIVVFLGIEGIAPHDINEYINLLNNQVLYLRSRGVLVFRVGTYVNELMYAINSSLATGIAKYICRREGDGLRREVYVWRNGRDPVLVPYELLTKYLSEEISLILGEL